jgi:predicted Fe-Mo cluster-binding NifX family protein
VNLERNLIKEEKIVPNHLSTGRKGIHVSEWLLEHGVDTVYSRKAFEGKGPSYVFSSAEADVVVTESRTIEEICRNLEMRSA